MLIRLKMVKNAIFTVILIFFISLTILISNSPFNSRISRTGLNLVKPDPLDGKRSYNSNQKFRKVLLVTYMRSGSTFLGDLVQQNRGIFYVFEPLAYLRTNVARINPHLIDDAHTVLKSLFDCDLRIFDKFDGRYPDMSRFRTGKLYQRTCDTNLVRCKLPEVIRDECLSAEHRILKVVRLNLRELKTLLEVYPEFLKDLKVVHNRRDPRGIFNSRAERTWCVDECFDVVTLCEEMRSDIQYYEVLSKLYPKTFGVTIRFEDLAIEPKKFARKLYTDLGFEWTSDAEQFINTHTDVNASNPKATHPYTTFRDSKNIPFQWLYQLNWTEVDSIQNECRDVMKTLGYKPITKEFFDRQDDFDVTDVIEFEYGYEGSG